MEEEETPARRGIVRALAIGLVIVVVLAVAAWGLLRGRNKSEKAQPASSSSATTNTTLDNIVPGTGALRASSNIPKIKVGYPSTCIGAGEAVAGWTDQVLVGVTPVNSPSREALEALLEDEILAPSYTRTPGGTDPADVLPKIADEYNHTASAKPVSEGHAEYGAFKLLSCNAGSDAEVTLYEPIMTNGWRANAELSDEAYESFIVYTFDLVDDGGEWRISRVNDLTAVQNNDHDSSLDYLDPYFEAANSVKTFMRADLQKKLVSAAGSGTHAYVSGK